MDYEDISISELIEKVDSGQIRLPEMQRGYVWKAKQVSDLLDSLYRGYPSGTILTWKADGSIPTRNFAVEQTASARDGDGDGDKNFELLLDGQQRLTSLLAILKGKFAKVRDKGPRVDVLFNLRHPDTPEIDEDLQDEDDTFSAKGVNYDKMSFATSNITLKNKKHWISVSKFFKSSSIDQFLEGERLNSSDSWIHRYRERLEKLKNIVNYKYRVDTLKNNTSYGEVTEIFVRVNSQGTKLKSSDLALAQITAKWPGSLEIFEEFAGKCKGMGFDFELGVYIKNLVVFATGQCRFETIARIPKQKLEDSWGKATAGMWFALAFLKDNAAIDSSGLMASPFLSIIVAYYAHKKNYKLSDEDERKLKYWVLLANIKGRYSRGSSESYLDKDLSSIKKDIDSALQKLIEDLEVHVKTLDIDESEMKNKNSSSPYFKAMFMAFREVGAKDWGSKIKISLSNEGKQKFEFHHIFPKKILNDDHDKEKINDIANLAFITKATNGKIGDKEPAEYLKFFEGDEDLFAKQCIPTDKNLLELENYEGFLEERRRLIVIRLNEFLKTGS